jgi:hypothetical protein
MMSFFVEWLMVGENMSMQSVNSDTFFTPQEEALIPELEQDQASKQH